MLLKKAYKITMRKYFLIKIFLVIILFALIGFQTMAQNGWTRKKDLPTPVSGASASVFNDKIFIIGGYTPSSGDLAVNQVYYPLADTFDLKAPMPTKRGYLLTVVINDTLYALGGGNLTYTNKNESYSPLTDSWSTKANLPYTWNGVYGDTILGIVYIMGGHYNRQDCFAYDPFSDQWNEKALIPSGGCKGTLSATAYNGLIYTFGGVTNYPNGPMSTVNEYNPVKDEWKFKTNMPTSRYALRTVLVNDKIYALGGSIGQGNSLSTIEVYDPADDTWYILPDMPFKISWFTATVYNNRIYVFGGTPDWATGGNEIWEYIPPSVFIKQPYIDKTYMLVNTDSVLFRTKFWNPDNLQFTTNLICTNSTGSQVDSVGLYDDGMHGDSLANDGLFAAYVPPQHNEDFYTLSVSVTETQTQNYRIIYDDCKFTTMGPLKIDSIATTPFSNFRYIIKPYISNQGTDSTISNIRVELYSDDPWVTNIYPSFKNCPDIMPGEVKTVSSGFAVTYDSAAFPGYFNLRFEMISNGTLYWIDTVNTVVTGIGDDAPLATLFSLGQNYPNPFNPSTKIRYSVPQTSLVQIKIFDVLGSELETLVNEEKSAGTYELTWNAEGLPSGVYFYQLKAGAFIKTKKMILMH